MPLKKALRVHTFEHMGSNVCECWQSFLSGEGGGREETERPFHKTSGRMDSAANTVDGPP